MFNISIVITRKEALKSYGILSASSILNDCPEGQVSHREMKYKNQKQENYKYFCPVCKSNSIKKDGFRKTENRGLIQRHKCKDCNHRFVIDDGFKRMRNNPQKITLCLDLFYRGVSTRKIQEHLGAFYSHNSDNSNIYRWIIKYAKRISKFTNSIKLNVGQEMQLDEMRYSRRKFYNRKGKDENWFIMLLTAKLVLWFLLIL